MSFVRSTSPLRAAATLATIALFAQTASAQVRAFPEAEGFASTITGGRGGIIYHVTNLNDSGPGSFRDAVSSSNRIVVFDVAGVINLSSAVSAKSNLTIAGQTAPGAGISLNGYEVSFANSTNVVCRYLRFRPGDSSPTSDDAISLYNAKDILLDHLSMEFGKWNNIDAVTDNGASPNVTIQNSLIADALYQQFGAHLEAVKGNFTLANNLWVNNHNRNPLAKVNEQFVNNIEYNNEAGYTTHTSTPFKHDLVNNAFIFGPASNSNSDYYQLSGGDTFYATGNVQDTNLNGAFDGTSSNPTTGTIVSTPNFASTPDLPTLTVSAAYNYVLAHAGASLTRDDLDQLVISQVQTLGSGTAGKTAGTTGPSGGLYGSAASTGLANGGLGTIPTSSRPAGFDADNDGIADSWESAHGLNPALPADALLLNPVGLRMIEQYLNELGNVNATRTYSATSGTLNAAPASWTGGIMPGPMDNARITGTGPANGAAIFTSGVMNLLSLDVGGNGPASPGESLSVIGGKLDVYDTLTIGANNNATLTLSNGTLEAYNVVLGNTVYSPSPTTYTGSLVLTGGTLRTGRIVLGGGSPGNWNTGGALSVTAPSTIQSIASPSISAPISLSNNALLTLDTNGFSGTLSGLVSGSGSLTKTGAGTLTLTAASTYTGLTTIKSGALALTSLSNAGLPGPLGAAASPANLVLDGGTLQALAVISSDRGLTLTPKGGTLQALSPATLSLSGDLLASGSGSRTLTFDQNSAFNLTSTLSGDIADPSAGGTTSVLKLGSGRLSYAGTPKTYSGNTTVSAGTLLAFAQSVLPFGPGKGNLVVASGATADLRFSQNINALSGAGTLTNNSSTPRTLTLGYGDASGTFTGVIAAPLNLTKLGAGTQVLSGANSYTGLTTVTAGTLTLIGPGAWSPVLDGAGADVQGPGARLVFEYSSSPSPLTALLADLAAGQVKDSTADATHTLAWTDDPATSRLTLLPALTGDLNLDGTLTPDDLALLDRAFAESLTGWQNGDLNYDNVVNQNDYLLFDASYVKAHGWQSVGSLLSQRESQFGPDYVSTLLTSIPEPTALSSILYSLISLLLPRRRR